MDIIEFQNKLKDIQTLALNNGKQVRAGLVEKFFGEEDMDQEKLQKVYDYLEVQGIRVTGRTGDREDAGQGPVPHIEKKQERVPLTAEEEEYLKEYLKAFGFEENLRDRQELLLACKRNEEGARESLVKACQRELADMARDLNCREVLFADLLSEANTALLMALEELKNVTEEEAAEKWLMHKVRNLVEEFLEEQTRQKREDNFLVEKVQNLEERVKALTEDENVKYSVEELGTAYVMDKGKKPCVPGCFRAICLEEKPDTAASFLNFLKVFTVFSLIVFIIRSIVFI